MATRQLSAQVLLTSVGREESGRLTITEFRQLTAELVRRGLRKSSAPSRPLETVSPADRLHAKASLARLFIAGAIDMAIMVAGFVVIWPVLLLAATAGHEDTGAVAVIGLTTLCYLFLRDARRGQSLGKRPARLMVVSLTTARPCSASDSAFRSLVLVLCGTLIPGIGWLIESIVAIVDKDGRRLGDRAADTLVIEVESYNAA